jgi:trehalose/maltose hydrolase-like predicted phosphorylase
VIDGFDPNLERVRAALLSVADGEIGIGGTALADHAGAMRWLVAGNVYAESGPTTHLLPGPVGFHLPYRIEPGAVLNRVLDLRTGVLYERGELAAGEFRAARFASLARPRTKVMRAACPDAAEGPALLPAIDGVAVTPGTDADVEWMSARAASGVGGGIVAAALDSRTTSGGVTALDRVVAYETDTEGPPALEPAARRVREDASVGYESLLEEQRRAWGERWADADIRIDGDDDLQLATRFALFHLMASVPVHGEAAVGARGLTGEGYRGHVFWDADTFTLPFLAATCPPAARAMLEYRLRRLPAARDIAHRAGRRGARFPWESARTGIDVTPRSALDRAGRRVPIRTGLIEEHIVAQVAWATCLYVDWSGDDEFAHGAGLELLVETARYWSSRARIGRDGQAHIYGVIGPDEYHETVDDNAYTNVMARWNLRRAADAVEAAPATDVDAAEIVGWRQLADVLVDGFDPATGVYEQFAGFHRLEPLLIEEVAPRRPIAAELLLGAERVRAAQILKQADVLMLHHQVPDEVAGTLDANLAYYEPRTAHGSSLSPAIHAALFARAGDHDRALDALRIAARLDLDDLTGTTASGLHLATMGGLWQALAFGFAGLRSDAGRLVVDPHHPDAWRHFEVRVRHRGSRVGVRSEPSRLTICAEPPAPVLVDGAAYTVGAEGLTLVRRERGWEPEAMT